VRIVCVQIGDETQKHYCMLASRSVLSNSELEKSLQGENAPAALTRNAVRGLLTYCTMTSRKAVRMKRASYLGVRIELILVHVLDLADLLVHLAHVSDRLNDIASASLALHA
jgi:hypothetical protein